MTRAWILSPVTAILLAGCGGGANNAAGNPPETGSPGMSSDTSMAAPAPGPADTAMMGTGADTATGAMSDTGMKNDTTKR